MSIHPHLPNDLDSLRRLFEPALVKPSADPTMATVPERLHLMVPGPCSGQPAAEVLATLSGLTLELAQDLIEFGALWSGPKPVKLIHRPQTAEVLVLNRPLYGPRLFYRASPERLIYQDEHLVIYNKEPGLPCQATPYDNRNQALEAVRSLLGLKNLWLPHRLDAPTSGLIIMAATKKAAAALSAQFQKQTVIKTYLALTEGGLAKAVPQRVDLPISKVGGRYRAAAGPGYPAITELWPLPPEPPESQRLFIQARPLTGRTHQIRLHLAAMGRPIVGDPTYGGPFHSRLMLAAFALEFQHPATGQQLKIHLPPPKNLSYSESV